VQNQKEKQGLPEFAGPLLFVGQLQAKKLGKQIDMAFFQCYNHINI